ncbi:MAG: valine--tRNA ligase [Treponema sp.]|jgi:valyl-tRNA synthetase|nr:valine--tRNA ligase [Treponema sp.]
MKAIELEKSYNPKSFEDRIYAMWKNSGVFKPEAAVDKNAPPFVIVIPPPNVTGVLHLGHGLVNSLQDIVIRYHRMRGGPVLWVPGTDHAGIATQHIVEQRLKEKGISRHDLGREKFIEETWKVKEEHHAIISKQLEKIGASLDWSRERFTMDKGLSEAVREVFVTLYERDLLYKGNYLVNWCTSCTTALSDDEVDHVDTDGKMYHIRYFFTDDKSRYVEIATTRPETLLGDTAVAVHPEDGRYSSLKGQKLRLPLTSRDIPVVFDTYVDRDFGTGAVKITPAHDPNDWELSKRHNLPLINILSPDGVLNGEVPQQYRGLSVLKARNAVLEDLKAGGWYIKEEPVKHSVGHCYRCKTVIEPYLSEQWFVRMKPLAEKALASWRGGEIIFYPKKWENTYKHWMENIRDWCVSRQLWWGHRIPAWYCKDCGKMIVSRNEPEQCPGCSGKNLEQDPDVLDTWFSSWLWPFSTLGWQRPGGTSPDMELYYPTTTLVTAYDIIFFWVSRMIMAGLEFTGKAPFRDIYIHGLVRDMEGRKMSKSEGNGVDPLELVDEFGADALKFTLAFLCAQGQDILVDKESFKIGTKFANKVWNASRYILMNLEERSLVKNPDLLPVDKWIYSRLNSAARVMEDAFNSYRYNDASLTVYEYFWNDFCDWYVEATKLSIKNGDYAEKDRAAAVLLDVLDKSLRLLHPLLPFVTEEIYQKLPAIKQNTMLINAAYPCYDDKYSCPQEEENFKAIQALVSTVRTIRSECTLTNDKKLRAVVRPSEMENIFILNKELIKHLCGLSELDIESPIQQKIPGSIGMAGSGFEVFVIIAEAVDTEALKKKFSHDLERDKKFIDGLKTKLANEQFLKNAPSGLVDEQRQKLEEALKRAGKIEIYLKDL